MPTTAPIRPTVSVKEAADHIGIAHSTAYAQIQSGVFPVKSVRVGSRILILTRSLLDYLDLTELPATSADTTNC